MSVWRRIARLLDQSRIRLPPQPLGADELRPRDWIQIGRVRWQVSTRRFDADRVVFRLRSFNGSSEAVLSAPRAGGAHWTLVDSGRELPVPPELLVVYPVV